MHIDQVKSYPSGRTVSARDYSRQASTQLADEQVQTNNISNITAYYFMGTTFYLIICIIRIEPSAQRRRLLFWVAAAFVAAALFLLGQMFWICESDHSAEYYAYVACVKADVISDSILLLAPLLLLRNLIDKSLGRKLTLLFSTCVVTTIVSLVHAAFILRDEDMKILISAIVEIQDCLSLVVANIPVVITTTIDIVGEPHQVQTGKSVQLTSVFWFSEAQTTGAIELHTIAEDPAKPPYVKNTAASARNQNDLLISTAPVELNTCTKLRSHGFPSTVLMSPAAGWTTLGSRPSCDPMATNNLQSPVFWQNKK
ncbi:hypothetical protein B0H13DRAFT_1907441 [Mycena leptocephala]|nr:hypothetical protein B0H13DRAFT_1907441 [Mycena leptocephala]